MAQRPVLAQGRPGWKATTPGSSPASPRFVIDVVVIAVLFSLGGHVVEYVLTVLLREPVRLSEAPVLSKVALVVWAFVYFAYPLAPPAGRSAWRCSACGRCASTAATSTGVTR